MYRVYSTLAKPDSTQLHHMKDVSTSKALFDEIRFLRDLGHTNIFVWNDESQTMSKCIIKQGQDKFVKTDLKEPVYDWLED